MKKMNNMKYDFDFETKGTNSFIVYKVKEGEKLDEISLGMIKNNHIPGILPVLFTQVDTQKLLKFNITSKVSVSQFFEGMVTKKRLLGVLDSITSALMESEEYMINPSSFILDLNYIYADVSSCKAEIICLPVENMNNENIDMAAFFKNIIFSIQFDQSENCNYVTKLITYLNSGELFSLINFKKTLQELLMGENSTVVRPVNNNAEKKAYQFNTESRENVEPQLNRNVIQTPNLNKPQTLNGNPMSNVATAKRQQPYQNQYNIPNQNRQYNNQQNNTKMNTQMPKQKLNNEKSMSYMHLLMHYNKENKEIYKQQKQQKKLSSQSNFKNNKKPVQNSSTNQVSSSFAIPGQAVPNNMNIPNSTYNQPMKPVNQNMNMQANNQFNSGAPNNSSVSTIQKKQSNYQNSSYVPVSQSFNTISANFGDTTVLGGSFSGETTVLNNTNNQTIKQMPYLIRQKNNERIDITKPVFRIGKEKSYVDYFISDNTAVSRSHANIIVKGNLYFIVDTNSTNHTFVNSNIIASNQEVELKNNTKIQLANELFTFYTI